MSQLVCHLMIGTPISEPFHAMNEMGARQKFKLVMSRILTLVVIYFSTVQMRTKLAYKFTTA